MSSAIAVQVRFNSWYSSLPSFAIAKQQREMANFALSGECKPRRLIFLHFYFKFTAVFRIRFGIVLTVMNKLNVLEYRAIPK